MGEAENQPRTSGRGDDAEATTIHGRAQRDTCDAGRNLEKDELQASQRPSSATAARQRRAERKERKRITMNIERSAGLPFAAAPLLGIK